MPTNVISTQSIIDKNEAAQVSACTEVWKSEKSIEGLAKGLSELGVSLALDPDIVEGFAKDQSNLPGEAIAVSRPKSERECAILMTVCQQCGIPVTLSGGQSNLTGSATPEGGVVLSTANMKSPDPEIDESALLVDAPVGWVLEELRDHILEKTGGKLEFPVDPTSRGDAWVGGCIACNASGFIPGENGAMRPWVESLDLILPDGAKVSATRGEYVSENGVFILKDNNSEIEWKVPTYHRPEIKNAGGPFSSPDGKIDLVDLIIGCEGIFGLVTRCKLKLRPRPVDEVNLFFSLPTEAEAVKLLDMVSEKLDGDLGKLNAFEYFGVNCRKYMDHESRFFAQDHQVGINLNIPVYDDSAEDVLEDWAMFLMEADCGIDEDNILMLDSPKDRELFMEARHSMPSNALEVVQKRGTITIMTDCVVPREKFDEFLSYSHGLINDAGLDYLSFGHFGDCHLHFTILPHKEQLDTALGIYDKMIAKSKDLGGTYSGEHGTGRRKRKDFALCYGDDGIRQVRESRQAVDPANILNRGVVVETA